MYLNCIFKLIYLLIRPIALSIEIILQIVIVLTFDILIRNARTQIAI